VEIPLALLRARGTPPLGRADPPFQRMLFFFPRRIGVKLVGNREEPSLSKRRLIDNGTAFPPSRLLPSPLPPPPAPASALLPSLAIVVTRPCRYNYYSSYLPADLHYI